MPISHTLRFARLYARLASLVTFRPLTGFCYTCEQPTQWTDDSRFYRCHRCGYDPVEHAPDLAELAV